MRKYELQGMCIHHTAPSLLRVGSAACQHWDTVYITALYYHYTHPHTDTHITLGTSGPVRGQFHSQTSLGHASSKRKSARATNKTLRQRLPSHRRWHTQHCDTETPAGEESSVVCRPTTVRVVPPDTLLRRIPTTAHARGDTHRSHSIP